MNSKELGAVAKARKNVEKDIIEHLRCHYCKGYLSCSPLRVLPDGRSICGRCEPSNNDVPVYRNLDVENALAMVTFPCRFQKNGCSMLLLFGDFVEHESACEYNTFTCFAAVLESCSWKGRISDISKHFSENHQKYWMEEGQQFRIVVKEDSKLDLVVFEKQNILTVFQCYYNSAKKILEYCIQYLPVDVISATVFYNIELHSIAHKTPRITIKNIPCLYQQTRAGAPKELSNINLEPCKSLGSSKIIVFSVNMMFESGKTPALNYDLLKLLKCILCGIYVTPPLFKDNEGELVCTDCGQKDGGSRPYEDVKMQSLMSEVAYPCRWVRCNVTRKVDSIRQHERYCQYRVFRCVVFGCFKIYKRGQIVNHFRMYHSDYSYFKDEIRFSVNISDSHKYDKKLFIVKNDEAIIIEFIQEKGKFIFKQIPSGSPNISAYVEHEYSGWRSKDFSLPNNFDILESKGFTQLWYSVVLTVL